MLEVRRVGNHGDEHDGAANVTTAQFGCQVQARHASTQINIEADPLAAALVERVNGGNQTVPTIVFEDGTAMTNPSLAQVKAKLALA